MFKKVDIYRLDYWLVDNLLPLDLKLSNNIVWKWLILKKKRNVICSDHTGTSHNKHIDLLYVYLKKKKKAFQK